MKQLIMIVMLFASLFSSTWQDRYVFEKTLFEHELKIISKQDFDISKYDKFKPLIKEFNLDDDFKNLVFGKDLKEFLKAKNRFFIDFDISAFSQNKKEFIDFGILDEDVSMKTLLTYRAKKTFITLSRLDLKVRRMAYDNLYKIIFTLEALKKPIEKGTIKSLLDAISNKDIALFKKNVEKLESIIQSLETKKLSQQDFEKKIKSFLRYNKLVSFDYTNGIDDGKIKVPLEYTEAVK